MPYCIMPAVLEQEEISQETPSFAPVSVSPLTPKKHAPWPKGFCPNPAGRPKGAKNKIQPADLLKRRELRITQHYIERTAKSDPVLIDAMKRILPVAEAMTAPTMQIVVFAGAGALPRVDVSTLQTPCIDAETMSLPVVSPSLPDPQAR